MVRLPVVSMVAGVLLASWLLAGCGRADEPIERGRSASNDATGAATPQVAARRAGLLVDVAGHVRRPGVYELASDARVHDAIAAAGGARSGAQLAALNRAAPVVDGQQILVPGPNAAAGGGVESTGAAGSSAAKISLNSATDAQLDELPGIGPVTAAHIVADRTSNGPFSSVDDLERVPGIGPSTIEAVRDLVTA